MFSDAIAAMSSAVARSPSTATARAAATASGPKGRSRRSTVGATPRAPSSASCSGVTASVPATSRASTDNRSGLPPVASSAASTTSAGSIAAAASRSSGRGRMTVAEARSSSSRSLRGARLVGARGRDQRHAQAVDAAGEVLEEAQRGDVRPVQIVGEQHDGHGVGEVRGQPVEAVQHREAGVLGGTGGGIEHDSGVGRGARHQLRRRRPVEQLVHEPEPEPAVQLARPRVQHERVTRRLPRRFEHGGLADARRTFQHEHGAGAVHGTGDRPRDRGELVLTRQQAPKHRA